MKLNFAHILIKTTCSKFLTCRDSINNHEKDAFYFCLCLDDFTFDYLTTKNFEDIKPISLKEIEEYLELKYAKNREIVEFYFTYHLFYHCIF